MPASLSFTNTQSLLKLISIELLMPSNHLTLCNYPSPPAFNLSSIRVFFSELSLGIRWPKYWSFSFSNSPSNEYAVLISFRIDWFDLLAVQGTLKSLVQHHSSKASILRCSAFFYCPALTTITWGLKTTQIYKVPVPLVRSSNMGLKSSSLGCVYSGCSRGRPSSLFFPASRGCLLMALSSIFLSSSTTFLHHHISFSDTPVSLFHFKDQQ